jgi:hypothetical protein
VQVVIEAPELQLMALARLDLAVEDQCREQQ